MAEDLTQPQPQFPTSSGSTMTHPNEGHTGINFEELGPFLAQDRHHHALQLPELAKSPEPVPTDVDIEELNDFLEHLQHGPLQIVSEFTEEDNIDEFLDNLASLRSGGTDFHVRLSSPPTSTSYSPTAVRR